MAPKRPHHASSPSPSPPPADTRSAGDSLPQPSANHNGEIVAILRELGEYEATTTRNRFKAFAYRKAAKAISIHRGVITSGAQARDLPGVGAKIAAKIDEILATGHLAKLDSIHADPTNQARLLLTSVMGVGPAHALALVAKGVTTLEQLRREPGLTHQQQLGLKYYDDLLLRIPRSEMDVLKDEFFKLAHEVQKDLQLVVCGSYRRGKPDSGDMDVLVTHPSFQENGTGTAAEKCLKDLVANMQRAGFVTDVITLGSQSSHMICRSTSPPPPGEHWHFRRLDIHVVPFAEYPMQVMYFTGSDEFNIRCRIRATQLGLHMNQSFLQPKGELGALGAPLPVHSERDIFEFLNMPYQDPTKR